MRNIRNRIFIFLFFLAIIIMISCINEKEEVAIVKTNIKTEQIDKNKQINKLTVKINEKLTKLHPATAKGTDDAWVLDHLFEGLTKKTPKGQLIGGMASNWYTDNGQVWFFKLKENVKWSDGTFVSAHDFEYAWKHVLNPKTGSQYAYLLYYIEGAEQYNKETNESNLSKLANKVGVEAINEKTLKVTLEKPIPYFADLVSSFPYYPINKRIQKTNSNWYFNETKYISNGPFKLSKWFDGNITIERDDNYYNSEQIKLDKIEYQYLNNDSVALESFTKGNIDILFPLNKAQLSKLSSSNKENVKIAPDLAVYYYNLNNNVKPLNNKKIRQALSLSINRNKIVNQVSEGGQRPAYSVVPEEVFRNNNDSFKRHQLFKEDVEKANKLLAIGLKEEKLTKFPQLTLLYNSGEGHEKVAKAVQKMWENNLGINIKLEKVAFQEKIAREHYGQYDISRAGWVGEYVDPSTFINSWASDSNFNDVNWNNKKFDKLIKDAKFMLDEIKRHETLAKAEAILIKEMPIIPIYFYVKPFLVQSCIDGVFTPIDKYPQLMYASICNKKLK